MPKYEIMLILDPKAEEDKTKKMFEDVFGKQVEKFEKMDRTELAYQINKSTTAKYFLAIVDSKSKNISEFTRKANLSKDIWRFLTINLDEEKANKEPRPRRQFPNRRRFQGNSNRQEGFSNFNRRKENFSARTNQKQEDNNKTPQKDK